MDGNEFLKAKIKRDMPTTQEECCLLGARQAIATLGPVDEEHIRAAARGLAAGLFGPAFDTATGDQAMKWIDMCERAYRQALGGAKQ